MTLLACDSCQLGAPPASPSPHPGGPLAPGHLIDKETGAKWRVGLSVPTVSRSSANDGIFNPRPLGSFVRYLSCRLHHSIRSRHRPPDPARTFTQGPGDCTRLASPRISAIRSPTFGPFLLFRAQSISYLRRRLGDIPKNTACSASSNQHPSLGLGVPDPCFGLLSNTNTPHSLWSHVSVALATAVRLHSLLTNSGVSLTCDRIPSAQQTSYPNGVQDEPISALRLPSVPGWAVVLTTRVASWWLQLFYPSPDGGSLIPASVLDLFILVSWSSQQSK